MITFIASIVALILGYIIYGKFVERIFGADKNKKTPAYTQNDGVDYVPLPWGKVFLIQFLNIAGLGPIFGAILGATYGPIAFLWIVFGCIFGGAVHDYFSGMLSVRNNGASIPEVVGKYLGTGFKQFMRAFTVLLMILVGAVFVVGPAGILESLTPESLTKTFWVYVVLLYYILATLLPIDKLIGRIYPLFGAALLFMAIGIGAALIFGNYNLVELGQSTFHNMKANSSSFPAFPLLFVTIACGAISGFHSTQSPLMARCLENEKLGRRVFYGAMITEGIVALIWAAAAMNFFGGVPQLNAALAEHHNDAAWVVKIISDTTLGKLGGILAILGVVAAPITSGDTAFRSARLIVADFLKFKQKKIVNRLLISVPLFAIGYALTQFNFAIIWRYMAWSNQTLATIVLWAITVYLAKEKKPYWITLIPAIFMTAVVSTYILIAPEGFRLPHTISYVIGGVSVIASIVGFSFFLKKEKI
ncbi:MAG: carbon starvation protein A [Bacteroidales bacterium]|nr:carbon starvation protein A [Bacteroidales bacterium]HPD94581.1 carbon starvation protein A [Tenuifilaceae bacterium]